MIKNVISMPPRNRDNQTSTWSIAVIAILIVIILVLLYPTIVQLIPVVTVPMVNVSGQVDVHGFTAVADHVTFIGGARSSTAAVGRNGSYDIMLQNGHLYNMTVEWTAAGGLVMGNCSGGSLNLHSSMPRLAYNISC